VASAILPITWVVKTSAVRDGAPRVYSYPLHAVDRTLVGLMGPPFQFITISDHHSGFPISLTKIFLFN